MPPIHTPVPYMVRSTLRCKIPRHYPSVCINVQVSGPYSRTGRSIAVWGLFRGGPWCLRLSCSLWTACDLTIAGMQPKIRLWRSGVWIDPCIPGSGCRRTSIVCSLSDYISIFDRNRHCIQGKISSAWNETRWAVSRRGSLSIRGNDATNSSSLHRSMWRIHHQDYSENRLVVRHAICEYQCSISQFGNQKLGYTDL